MNSSEEESEDECNDYEECLNDGLEELRCLNEIEDTVQCFSFDGVLPWRIFRNSSDNFVLWSAASRALFRAPVYSDEPTESGVPIVLHNAQYETLPLLGWDYCSRFVHKFLTPQESIDFERELDNPYDGGMVHFVHTVLDICNMPQDHHHVYDFLARLDYSNMLRCY